MTDMKTSSATECKARVLVVENDLRTAELHRRNLIRWGYEPYVATGTSKDLLEDAQKKAHEYACHIALVDMRLMDDYDKTDKSGIDLVPALRPTVSIIVSGSGNDRPTALEAIRKGAVDFIGKEEPLDKLRNAIKRAALDVFCGNTDLEIHIHEDLPHLIMNTLAPNRPSQVLEIFRALFPTANNVFVKPIGAEARTPKATTRQRSFVFRVNADDLQPVIVKFANVERIKDEADKYTNHIQSRVRGNFYAQIQHTVLRWHIGAIVYDFIGADQDQFSLFRDYYDSATPTKLKKVIDHLFETTWGTIYRQTKKPKTQSLLDAYTEVWGKEWLQRLARHADAVPEIPTALPDELRGVNPVLWLMHRAIHAKNDESLLPHAYVAICHGDMLGDNFFVDQHEQTWTIDYERTGLGPVVQDFVLLEIDILVRLVSLQADDLTDFFCLSVQLIEKFIPKSRATDLADDELKKAYGVVRSLRQKADTLLDYEKERHYLWGLLFNALFRLTILQEKLIESERATNLSPTLNDTDTFTQLRLEQQRALIIGVLICHRLENWDKSWPPKSWENFLPSEPNGGTVEDNHIVTDHIKILFIAANPSDTTRIRIDEEQRRIDQELRRAELRDHFQFITHHAVRVEDLQDLLQRHKPTIVHFSGHGTPDGEILLNDEAGSAYPVPPKALSNLFRVLRDNIQCIVLNACYSKTQAIGIVEQIDTVVGMASAVDDDASIRFATGFYSALGNGRSMQEAFELGKIAIELRGSAQSEMFQLLVNNRVDPRKVYLHKPF